MGKIVSKNTKVITTIKYMSNVIWENDRKYFLYIMLEIVLKPIRSICTIILPMKIVENLMIDRWFVSVLYTVFFLVSELLIKSILDYLNYRANVCEDYFEYLFNREYCSKCLDMPYEVTENSEKLEQIQEAKDGLDWSGGVSCVVDAAKEIIASIISLASVFGIIYKDTPFLIVLVILVVIIKSHFEKKEIEENQRYYSLLPNLNRKMDYYLRETSFYEYGKDIRLYGAKMLLLERANKVINENAQEMKNTAKKLGNIRVFSLVMESLCNVLQYLYVGIYTMLNNIPISQFTMLISSTSVMTSSIEIMFEEYNYMIEGSEYFYRYYTFIENSEYNKKIYTKKKKIEDIDQHIIELKNVYFSYPNTDRLVLEDINITIRSGEKLSIVGLNGEGKTTLIKLICGLYKPTSGKILLDGVDIYEYYQEDYKKLMAPVFQDFRLFATTIDDNIILNDEYNIEKMNVILKKYGMYDKTAMLNGGLKNELLREFDDEGYQPSGGESQKLALIRADYRDTPFIILDEPTAALDPEAEYSLYKDVKVNMENKTILFISHRMSACKFCDRIIVLSKGKIVEEGNHNELIKLKGIYSELFEAQAENYC